MNYKSAQKKKEKNQVEIRRVLNSVCGDDEKTKIIFKYFQSLRLNDLSKAMHAYKNFLCMDESKKIMELRYFSEKNNVCNVMSYGTVSDTLISTIRWVTVTLDYFHNEINKYIELKDSFDKALMLSNYDEAASILEEVENISGVSLWSVNSRLNMVYFKKDIQEYNILAKEYVSISDEYSRSVVSYDAIRCNKAVSPERYLFSIGKMIEEFRIAGDDEAEEALSYRHNFDPTYSYSKIEFIYKSTYEQRCVDVYNSFLKIISYCQTHGININDCIPEITKLSTKIHDRSLSILSYRLSKEKKEVYKDFLQDIYNEVMSLYLREKYNEVIRISEEVLNQNPSFSVLFIPYAKSLVALGNECKLPGLLGEIINIIKGVYQGFGFEDLHEKLKRYALVLNHNMWAHTLNCVLAEFDGTDGKRRPLRFNFIDNILLYENLMSLTEGNATYFDDCSIPDWRRNKYYAELHYFNGNYRESLTSFNLIKNKSIYVTSRIIQCHYHLNEIDLAVEKLSQFLINSENAQFLPLVLIAKSISRSSKYSKDNRLLFSKAVILHYYKQGFGSDLTQTLSDICENYCENLGFLASQDIRHRDEIDDFMLEDIMSLDVIDGMSTLFAGDIDVLMCRINIIRNVISSRDKHTSHKISKALIELKDLFHRTVVEVCSNEAGEGRLYVDRNGIKTRILSEVTKEFNLLANDLDRENDLVEHDSIQFTKDIDLNFITSDKTFVNGVIELLYIIYNSYAVDRIYGLDQSLNMGIRHGGIINLLWAPIKENNLSATKLKDGFTPNPSWRTFFGYYLESIFSKIDGELVKFNFEINKIISETRSKVNIDTGEFGLEDKWFLFSPDKEIQDKIIDNFDSYTPESLIDEVLSHLDKQTDYCLQEIRENHIPLLESNLMNEITKLENALDLEHIGFVNLKRSISRSKAELKLSIERLDKWFGWSGESKTNFDMNAVIGKSISAVRQFHSWMEIRLVSHVSSTSMFKGAFFTKTVMLLTLLFENAVKHSNIKEDLLINIDVNESETEFTLKITNSVDKNPSEIELNKLEKINNDLANNNIDNFMKDFGSGLYKVKKILSLDLKTESDVFVENNNLTFTVNVNFKKNQEFMSIEE
ncbi:hypothetical protein [Pantoea ananatis]|uniref:hypothetical protein n=1 Tax=Pantoea ananas TaxID=553 RepID=UPI0023B0710B|nr:hypothetical protein [Pantoea ananatis]